MGCRASVSRPIQLAEPGQRGTLNAAAGDLGPVGQQVEGLEQAGEAVDAAPLRVEVDELGRLAGILGDGRQAEVLTMLGMKHSLCFTSIVSKAQPSLSIPTKKSWVLRNSRRGAWGSLGPLIRFSSGMGRRDRTASQPSVGARFAARTRIRIVVIAAEVVQGTSRRDLAASRRPMEDVTGTSAVVFQIDRRNRRDSTSLERLPGESTGNRPGGGVPGPTPASGLDRSGPAASRPGAKSGGRHVSFIRKES